MWLRTFVEQHRLPDAGHLEYHEIVRDRQSRDTANATMAPGFPGALSCPADLVLRLRRYTSRATGRR